MTAGFDELERPARQCWSTADVESRHALAYWVDAICKSFLEIDIDSPERQHFHRRLDALLLQSQFHRLADTLG